MAITSITATQIRKNGSKRTLTTVMLTVRQTLRTYAGTRRQQIVYWSVITSSIGVVMDPKFRGDFWVWKAAILGVPVLDISVAFRNRLFLNLSTGSNQSMNAINSLVDHLTGIEYPHSRWATPPSSHSGSAYIRIDRCTAVDSEVQPRNSVCLMLLQWI